MSTHVKADLSAVTVKTDRKDAPVIARPSVVGPRPTWPNHLAKKSGEPLYEPFHPRVE
jgi:hypothetical protein